MPDISFSETPTPSIKINSSFESLPMLLVASAINSNLPPAVGVPVILPSEESVNPVGKGP